MSVQSREVQFGKSLIDNDNRVRKDGEGISASIPPCENEKFLKPEFENLHEQNLKKLRKPKYKRAADALSREIATFKRCNKQKIKKNKKKQIEEQLDFEAQMFPFNPISLKMDDQQFAVVSEIATKLSDVVNSAKGEAEGATANTLKGMGGMLAEGAWETVTKEINETIEGVIAKYGRGSAAVIAAIVLVFLYRKSKSKKWFFGALGAFGAVLVLLKRSYLQQCLKLTIEYFENRWNGEIEMEAQMFDEALVVDMATLFLGASLFPKTLTKKGELFKAVSDLGRGVKSIGETVKLVFRITQRLLDYGAQKFGLANFTLVETMVPKVDEWIKETRELLNSIGMGKHSHDLATFEKIQSLEDRAYDLLSTYARNNNLANVGMVVRPLSNELTKMRMLFQNEGVGLHKLRQAPLIISFAGTSQIGKSRLLRPFVARLLSLVTPEEELKRIREDFDSHVYSRQPEHEFWDGYCGQMVCFIDEKDLVKESLQSAHNASTDIIRMGNVFMNVLHMAGIEQKGNVYFRSKIVVTTSNIETSIQAARNSVRYPEAVVNRFHFEVIVQVNEKYIMEEDRELDPRDRRLDPSKLPPDGSFDPNVHEYIILKRVRDVNRPKEIILVPGNVMNMEELLFEAAQQYNKLQRQTKAMIKDDAEAFAEGLRMRLRKEKPKYGSGSEFFVEAQMDDAYYDFLATLDITSHPEIIAKSFESIPKMDGAIGTETANRVASNLSESFDVETKKILSEMLEGRVEEKDVEFVTDALSETDILAMTQFWKKEQDSKSLISKVFSSAVVRSKRLIERAHQKSGSIIKWISEFLCKMFGEGWDWESIVKFTTFLGSFVGVVTAGLTIFKAYSWFSSEEETKDVIHEAQAFDPSLDDIAMKIWKSNYYALYFEGQEGKPIGWGFFTKDNVFNVCYHYVNTWKQRGYDEPIVLRSATESHIVPMKVFEDFVRRGEDWAQGIVPTVRRHADITNLMCDVSVLSNKPTGNVMMIRCKEGVVEKHFAKYSVGYSMRYKDPSGALYRLPVYLKYDIATQIGECGLPIFIVDPTTRSRKFLGFHVAGSKTFGSCFLFPKEENDVFEAQLDWTPSTMQIVGSVPRGLGSTGISNIRKTPLYGAWGPAKKAPAKLRPFVDDKGERVDPFMQAIARYDKPVHTYDEKLVKACVSSAINANTCTSAFEIKPAVISLEEAVLGVPGKDFAESINRSTSPGYPWNLTQIPGYKGKERFFGRSHDISFDGPDWPALKKEIDEAEDLLLRGKRPEFLFCDSLKDETVSLEKASIGKTRMFCPSPIVYQILFKKYFGDFLVKMMESRIETEHAVGINVYSGEWDMLYRELTKHGRNKNVAGDFRHFDANQAAQILREIGEGVIQCFSDREYDNIRRILWMEVWNSKHIVGRSIVLWLQSLPSGHPATTLINCLFVAVVMRMCWVKAHHGALNCLRFFSDNVTLKSFGDDNALNLSDYASKIFNQIEIAKFMAELGLEYTSEDKDSNPPPLRDIEEIEFLKRSWRYEPLVGRYVAPLRLETILEMPYWSKKEGFEEIWRVNLDNAIRELALHPPEVFAEWSTIMLNKSWERASYRPLVFDRETLVNEISGMDKLYGPAGRRANNQGYLVGVELNPGPRWATERPNNQGFLVGVEPNPGPFFWPRLLFLLTPSGSFSLISPFYELNEYVAFLAVYFICLYKVLEGKGLLYPSFIIIWSIGFSVILSQAQEKYFFENRRTDIIVQARTLNIGHLQTLEIGFKWDKTPEINQPLERLPWVGRSWEEKPPYLDHDGTFCGTISRSVSVQGEFRGQNLSKGKRPASITDNNTMTSVTQESNDMSGTTHVMNEALTTVVKRAHPEDIHTGLLDATRVGMNQSSVYDFLAKPVALTRFAWSSQAAGDILANISMPQDAFAFPIYANKINGFLGFRGTAVFRLQVNGNRFQAGRLIMAFVPQGNVLGTYPAMRVRSLMAITQLPRAELDLATETEITFEVPYISPTPFYDITTSIGAMGRLYIAVYSPLATGGTIDHADVTLWCSFKDVELTTPVFQAQMNDRRPKGKSVTAQELEAAGDRPISYGLSLMSKAADNFAKIPLLTTFAKPAGWALQALAGTASAFGYSKPTSEKATTKVAQVSNFNFQNANGVDIFPNMGLDAENSLQIMPGFAGTDVDEMTLSHLVQIPAYYQTISWTTANTPGTRMMATSMCPPPPKNITTAVNGWIGVDLLPVSYFSRFFQYWRGSLVFTLKIVKTQFHSGRLLFTYNPVASGVVTPTLPDTDFLLREIIDIRDSNEFKFVVPYSSVFQYLLTYDMKDTTNNSLFRGAAGMVELWVLNDLVCPDTCADSVQILVEIAGGPDFCLADPKPFTACPLIEPAWVAQMSDVVPATKDSSNPQMNQDPIAVGNATVGEHLLIPAQYCMGEKCNSILQLLKRYTVVCCNFFETPRYSIDLRPFTNGAATTTDPLQRPDTLVGDYLDMFVPCFAYSRGSVRVAVSNWPGDVKPSQGGVWTYPSSVATIVQDVSDLSYRYAGLSRNYQPSNDGAPKGANVPPYQPLHCRLNRLSTSGLIEPAIDLYTSQTRMGAITVDGEAGEPLRASVSRAAGDDFCLGYFIGVPRINVEDFEGSPW
ncbi:hypothetical protein [Shahe picorna-like virus 10]|uniref:hypothetical protein n=1 Tax=Shahe picorna-like virus 10 TaxID=1923440 RepID=UPI00090B8261|nr:hypothetical protein [Shahe picorna-like virus 10]APG77386.1 hypothetical protein [Shahe picorna-like virus 10]